MLAHFARFQRYMVIEDPELLLPVPEGVPMDCAATAMCGGVTAHNSVQSVRQSVDEAIKLRGKLANLNPITIFFIFLNLYHHSD